MIARPDRRESLLIWDWIIFVSVPGLLFVWWNRRLKLRTPILFAVGSGLLVISIIATLDFRPQAIIAAIFGLLVLGATGWSHVQAKRKSTRTVGIPYISGTLLSLGGAIAIAAIYFFPARSLPTPSGEHSVGIRTFELVDNSRFGVLGRPADEPRRLLVHVWYPANPDRADRVRRYYTKAELKSSTAALGRIYEIGPLLNYLHHAKTNSYVDAPLASPETKRPTLFYSHGFGLVANQNTGLMEHLASHGYIVYAIQHTVEAADTAFSDGQVVPYKRRSPSNVSDDERARVLAAVKRARVSADLDDRLAGQLEFWEYEVAQKPHVTTYSVPVWLDDRRFVLDALFKRETPLSVMDIVSASEIAQSGHFGMSRGGSSVGGFCMVDARCAAGINIDGSDNDQTPFAETMPQPFMMLRQDPAIHYARFGVDEPLEHWANDFSYEAFRDAGSTDVTRIALIGFNHLGFSDYSWFVRRPLRNSGLGSQSDRVMIEAQNDFVRGFFDKHLREIDNSFPAKQLAIYPDIAVQRSTGGIANWWNGKSSDEQAEIMARIDALKAQTAANRTAP